MIKLTTNTRGKTAMSTNFKEMTGPQLVEAYNKMATAKGLPPVKRFSNAAVGLRRCLDLSEGKAAGGAKKTAAKPVKKVNGAKEDKRSPIGIQFEVRHGTVKAKIVDALGSAKNKQLPINVLLKAGYGSMNVENKGALGMVLKGVQANIKKHRLPFNLVKEKNAETKEISFGLHAKK